MRLGQVRVGLVYLSLETIEKHLSVLLNAEKQC